MKRCQSCEKLKNLDDFHKKTSQCKGCCALRKKKKRMAEHYPDTKTGPAVSPVNAPFLDGPEPKHESVIIAVEKFKSEHGIRFPTIGHILTVAEEVGWIPPD